MRQRNANSDTRQNNEIVILSNSAFANIVTGRKLKQISN